MKTMYPAMVNSPEVVTRGALAIDSTEVQVSDGGIFSVVAVPYPATLGKGSTAETVLVTAIVGDVLTITRAFEGTARAWDVGTVLARNFTAYDHRAFKENIEENRDKVTALENAALSHATTGTATALILTLASITSLTDGLIINIVPALANGSVATSLAINSLGAKSIYKDGTTTAPKLEANKMYTLRYSTSGGCFFLKAASATLTGTAVAANVLKDKTFYNTDSDTQLTGTYAAPVLSGNAVAADVMSGKTFYGTDATTKLTGTLAVPNFNNVMPILNNSENIGGVCNDTAENGDYLYVSAGYYIKKLHKLTLEIVASSPSYGASIQALAISGDYIYAGGDTSGTIKKYDLATLTLQATSPSYGGGIYALAASGEYIYAGGGTNFTIKKYKLSDLTFVATSPSYGYIILVLAISGSYIFCAGGGDTSWTIKKYDLATLTLQATSINNCSAIQALVTSGDYVYCNGGTNEMGFTINRFNLSNLMIVATTIAIYDASIQAISISGDYIYGGTSSVSSNGAVVNKYRLSDLSFVKSTPKFWSHIAVVRASGDYVYVAGGSMYRIMQCYDKAD